MAGKFVENYKKRFVNPYNFIPFDGIMQPFGTDCRI